MTIRVAAIRDGKVETVMAAPDEITDMVAYGLWAQPLLTGPFQGCELRALRDDTEAHVSSGMLFDGSTFTAPPTPIGEQIERINAQTLARIEAGFDFRGQRFSLSERSQITISNAYTIRDSLPYPIDWANADDTAFVTLTSAADMAAMYQAATLAVLQARVAGNAAKKAALG